MEPQAACSALYYGRTRLMRGQVLSWDKKGSEVRLKSLLYDEPSLQERYFTSPEPEKPPFCQELICT